MTEEHAEPLIYIAITGPLSEPRSRVAELIDATANGQFVEILTTKTHYLVCAKADSNKAKKAARFGTAVISEAELREYITSGRFPSTALPKRFQRAGTLTSDIEWRSKQPEMCLLTYTDARSNSSIRQILWISNGISRFEDGAERDKWIGGYDGPQFKSWRADRIVELEVLSQADAVAID